MRFFGKVADYIRECDKILYSLCIFASLYGAIAVFSATRSTEGASEFLTQLIALLVGLVFAVAISIFDFDKYLKYWLFALAVGVIPVVLTFFIGWAPPGTDDKAWLYIAGVSVQPSEFLKVMFLVSFSAHLDKVKERINDWKVLIPVCVHGFAPTVLVHFQGDDGTAIVFGVMALGMLFAAGLDWKYFVGALAAAVVASPFAYFFLLNDDQRTRIWNIFNIEADIKGAGFQQYRGRVALAGGGFWGQGFGKGELTQAGGVPEGHNDFIFCSIGEEFGFFGCLVLMIVLAGIAIRILHIGKMCRKKSGSFICVGMFSMLLVHIIINIGMCCSLLPVIGITLPFFSAGGTSLLCLFMGIGLVMSVYIHRNSRTIYLRDDY